MSAAFEATPKTEALLSRLTTETALVPAWWFIEITNVLAMAERKGRITPNQSDAFIADLGKLAIERDDEAPNRAFTYLLPLCRGHRLASYARSTSSSPFGATYRWRRLTETYARPQRNWGSAS